MFVYGFGTYHMSFIKNEHVNLYETYIDSQGRFKANLSKVMDVLGRLTSKLLETLHTAYILYYYSFKDLITL